MVRQRDALRSLLWWYMLPFLPGMVLVVSGAVMLRGGPRPLDAVGIGAVIALFALVWWINQHFARKLQRHIAEIDALIGGEE